jgi:hypothetical protein
MRARSAGEESAMIQPTATAERDTGKRAQYPAEPLATCQVCGTAHRPDEFIFCSVCGEPVIVWGWAP